MQLFHALVDDFSVTAKFRLALRIPNYKYRSIKESGKFRLKSLILRTAAVHAEQQND